MSEPTQETEFLRETRFLLPRAPGFSLPQVILAYGGRFSDELMSGLPDVLMPTIQQVLGLNLAQIAR